MEEERRRERKGERRRGKEKEKKDKDINHSKGSKHLIYLRKLIKQNKYAFIEEEQLSNF